MKTHTLLLALVLLLLPSCGFAQAAPLDRAEILGRLTRGYPPSYVAHLVKTRGINFPSTADFLAGVQLAGGDGILVERLSSPDLIPATNSSNRDRPYGHFVRCAQLIHVGNDEDAQQECLAAIDENPESAWPILAAFRVSTEMGIPPKDNVALLRRALALESNLVDPHRALASAEVSGEENGQVMQKLAALEQAATSDDYVVSGAAYAGVNSFRGLGGPGDIPPESRGYFQEQISSLLQKYPDLAAVHLRAASSYFLLGDLDKMQGEVQEAFHLEPGNPQLHLDLAEFFLSQQNAEAELAEYREAIRIAPYVESTRSTLVEALVREQRTDEAIREWKDFLALSPRNIDATHSLIDLYLNGQDRKSAIAELRRSLKASSDASPDQAKYVDLRVQDLDRLAHLLNDNREFAAAAEQYTFLLRYKPDNSVLHNNLGNVFFAQHRCDEATREYREALRLQPDLPDAHHNLANCLLFTQKGDEAIGEYQQALELDPSKYQTHMMLASALLQKGEINSAMEQLQQCLALAPENAEVHMLLGHAHYMHKDFPPAITELKHALSIKPDFPHAENELAWIYATAEDANFRNPSEALRLAEHAVQTSPQPVPAILDTLAEALLQNGQPAEALKTEQQAASLDPKNPEMQARLGHFQAAYSSSLASKQ